MKAGALTLLVSEGPYAICRLPAADEAPAWGREGGFYSLTRTWEELSVVCAESAVPEGIAAEKGWRLLRVEGRLDFALTGVLASIAGPLAEAAVSLFAISTFDTDYFLVKEADLSRAVSALSTFGHRVSGTVHSPPDL